jgi:hypothetical protein
LPILSGLSQQCYHPYKEVRQLALGLLQKTLLIPELVGESSDVNEIIAYAFLILISSKDVL